SATSPVWTSGRLSPGAPACAAADSGNTVASKPTSTRCPAVRRGLFVGCMTVELRIEFPVHREGRPPYPRPVATRTPVRGVVRPVRNMPASTHGCIFANCRSRLVPFVALAGTGETHPAPCLYPQPEPSDVQPQILARRR